jgi:uncharacterized protein with PhoU and TrkA domain
MSELMVNLAYCSIFFGDKEVTNEINKLEEEIDKLKSMLMMHAALATRDKWDAERLVSILDIIVGIDKISDAAGDISLLAENGITLDVGEKDLFLNTATTLVYSLKIDKDSIFIGKRIRDIYSMIREIFDVIAIRRGHEYILSPDTEIKVEKGDILFINGLAENIKALVEAEGRRIKGRGIRGVEEGLIDLLLNVKDISELMIDLAYSALFTHSRELAYELESMEETLDRLTQELKTLIIKTDELEEDEKIGMLEIASACERMGDAAMDITYGLRRGLEPHPLIEDVLESTDERISLIRIDKKMAGKNIRELGIGKYSVEIIALKRGRNWLVTPPTTGLILEDGDVLLLRYYSEAEEYISQIATEEEREETKKDIQEEET